MSYVYFILGVALVAWSSLFWIVALTRWPVKARIILIFGALYAISFIVGTLLIRAGLN